ncbi:MAG TPA: AraC family transcriptional regulator [Bacillota bacterium]|nr:AraC family transcriptional regulator [Bacillota bacterium]HQJ37686.1 AraC family transcriptional regulator [Bacillota bacterium]HQL36563.1 AraC family transcriptional regulator [Bacillota bacterium]
MGDLKSIINKLRTFHHATLVPINLLKDNKSVYCLPESISYISSIIKDAYTIEDIPGLSPSGYSDSIKSYYLKSDYDECFIVLHIKENYQLVAGPVLNEKKHEGIINNIIRLNKLPIKVKGKLVNYFDNLLVINTTRCYYCGKLLEYLFGSAAADNLVGDASREHIFISDDYFTEMIKNREKLFHHPPYFLEQELLSKIKSGNLNDTLAVLKEINSLKRTRLSKDVLRSVKNSLICSVTLFTRAAIEGGVTPEAAFTLSDSIILAIEEINNMPELMEYEYTAAKQYVQIVQDLSRIKYSNIIQQAISYIYKNLTNKLTLQKISDAIYVHPNYLSGLFKREVGMSLPDYIMKTRVDESKYYIRYTNTKISDIAAFYQFCNQSYYTQVFRKFAGCTPNEYREKYNQQNE